MSPLPPSVVSCIRGLTQEQADDEVDKPYLAGFEWDKEESWTRLVVHLQANAGPSNMGGGKKKKQKGGAADE